MALYNVKYQNEDTRPGKLTVCYGKSPFLMGKYGKSSVNGCFNSYVKLPQGHSGWEKLEVLAGASSLSSQKGFFKNCTKHQVQRSSSFLQ